MDIRREADELVRYYSELRRRLAQNGVRDIAELLALHDRLSRALATFSSQEIGWIAEQAQHLVEALVRMDSNLAALRHLKTTLEGTAESPRLHALRGRQEG